MKTKTINPRHYKYMSNKELAQVAEGLTIVIQHPMAIAYKIDATAKFNAIRRTLQGRGYDLNPQGELIENR